MALPPPPAPKLPPAPRKAVQRTASQDDAAKEAKDAIMRMNPATATLRDVAAWWNTYYKDAGHKRLARILLDRGLRK